MTFRLATILVVTALGLGAAGAQYQVDTRSNVDYAEHDGVKLAGDLYLPKGLAKAPVLVAVHGGGWQGGSPASYRQWGPYLAKNGFGVFAVRYRLAKPGVTTYPQAVYDIKAAVQFLRAKAGELGVDPERIGAMGDSAGAHLVALVALAGDEPLFSSEYRNAPNAATPSSLKAVVGFYGVYDLWAQWQHDQIARPRDQIAEKFLGASPMQNRRVYFDSSPASYAIESKNRTRFVIVHGTNDDVVDVPTQSTAFQTVLKQAGFFARTVVVPGAGHYFVGSDSLDDPTSFGAFAAPKVLRMLEGAL
ncbi:MAG: hypothetical protein QOI12_5047 [Alphaproteobacteria bacterium]|jgi:acetyl esterase/lipase|nr:hypothetical protein [Alphaproteobacteria bacterium]